MTYKKGYTDLFISAYSDIKYKFKKETKKFHTVVVVVFLVELSVVWLNKEYKKYL